jgi:hypothetical protein
MAEDSAGKDLVMRARKPLLTIIAVGMTALVSACTDDDSEEADAGLDYHQGDGEDFCEENPEPGTHLGPCTVEYGSVESDEVFTRWTYEYDGDTVTIEEFDNDEELPSRRSFEVYDANRNLLQEDLDNQADDEIDERKTWTYNEHDDIVTHSYEDFEFGTDGGYDQEWQYNEDGSQLSVLKTWEGLGADHRFIYHYHADELQKNVDVDDDANDSVEYVIIRQYDDNCNLLEIDHDIIDEDYYSYQLTGSEYVYNEQNWLIQRIVYEEMTLTVDYYYDDLGNMVRQELAYEGSESGAKFYNYDYSCWE